MRYVWHRARSVDAQVVGEVIEDVADRHGGVCPTWALVDAARPDDHPMHRLFQWDDLIAAEAYRREQARHVVRELRVVVDTPDGDEEVQAFVHVVRLYDDGAMEGYRLTRLVVECEDEYEQVLREALAGLRAWERRFRHLSGLDDVFGVIRTVI